MSPRILTLSCLFIALSCAGCEKLKTESGQRQKRPPKQAAVLSAAVGDVFFKSAHGQDWHLASAGYRLISGDAVSTGPRSRAEVQTRGPASLIRIHENAAFALEQSDSAGFRTTVIHLLKGGAWGSVKGLDAGEEFTFASPVHASIRDPATFRMEMREDGSASLCVYEGEVHVKRPLGETGRLDIQTVTKDEGLLMPRGEPSRRIAVPPDDPWRRGWKARREEMEEEPDTAATPRIGEKR
ncbi:MAG: hypothetical protein A3F84_02335 [Candidatus Handelsmanbacteria bacterium RIFCSPLOWO2_12_FULL_64_10]|uniref:FecR protein domain-containing protein n=1 Tax=Handelsmanbacteria sp. (strain RIFCSPLOWO2_12_FULL_64_10) TaxID=1817868 RepID=A0A1F6C2L2_HANXR|nr:MAG: hypothetical protein A3F84_02335 [Candidatus Handelsmanbacteria bacterium RIFCSPLOWO2_12_FULL_64_10]